MGAVALETGGVLIDDGWVRELGGAADTSCNLALWNQRDGKLRLPGALVVANDPVGGFFAINGGAFGDGSALEADASHARGTPRQRQRR